MKYKSPEDTIREKEKADREELRQLRNLRRNLESGIVFSVSSELRDVLDNYADTELKQQISRVKNIPSDLMKILLEWDVKDL